MHAQGRATSGMSPGSGSTVRCLKSFRPYIGSILDRDAVENSMRMICGRERHENNRIRMDLSDTRSAASDAVEIAQARASRRLRHLWRSQRPPHAFHFLHSRLRRCSVAFPSLCSEPRLHVLKTAGGYDVSVSIRRIWLVSGLDQSVPGSSPYQNRASCFLTVLH
jgi:hypothetical protein